MSYPAFSALQLRVVADADPGVLARVLERFQNLNLLPRRVTAEFGTNDLVQIEVDVCGLSEEQLTLIAHKIGQTTSVVNVYWRRI
jgi:hypothetical protein